MKTTSNHLSQIILAVAAIALVVGIVLTFTTPIGGFFSGVTDKLQGIGTGDIWNLGEYGGGSGGSGSEEQIATAGLYQTGTDTLLTSWDGLLDQGIVHVENGVVYTNVDMETGENSSSDALAGDLVLPDDGTITAIGDFDMDSGNGNPAFAGCTSLTSITIPDGVTTIGTSAFAGCTSLTSVGPVGSGASVEIPNSVTSIGAWAFMGCSSSSITIPEGVETIGDFAFTFCTSLTSITIPDGVTSIGEYAFSDCTSLTSITIPDSVTTIGICAFDDCTGLETVTFGENSQLETISSSTFRGCTNLTSITIPDSVTTIDQAAFQHCERLTSINIPDGVTSIGTFAFQYCTQLKTVYYDGTLAQWCNIICDASPCENGAALYIGGELVEDVVIPSTVTAIKGSAFNGCTSLKTVTFGTNSQLTSIGELAFYDCTSLTSIEIPASVTSIEYRAFIDCTSLETIKFTGTVAQWNAISKGYMWNYNVPATEVVCSDGNVSLS